MKYLFSDWGRIEKTLKDKFIYLFLDYDGTLAPIARTPGTAAMPGRTKDILRQLSEMPNHKIAVISGRALKDISKKVGLKNIVYVGNHGFEIKGPKINFESPLPPRYRRTLEEIKDKLEKSLSSIKGIFMEDKGFSLSVHYRLADKESIPAIEAGFYSAIFLHEFRNSIQVKTGKMVLEVRPPGLWNKGKAVLWLLGRRLFIPRNKKMKVLPIYIGDDTTDEDAFECLKDKGMTIFVGKHEKTKAGFYLKEPGEVTRFLEAILKKVKIIIGIMLIFSSFISAAWAEKEAIRQISGIFSEKINKRTDPNVAAPPSAQPGSYSLTPPRNQPKDKGLKDFLHDNFGA